MPHFVTAHYPRPRGTLAVTLAAALIAATPAGCGGGDEDNRAAAPGHLDVEPARAKNSTGGSGL